MSVGWITSLIMANLPSCPQALPAAIFVISRKLPEKGLEDVMKKYVIEREIPKVGDLQGSSCGRRRRRRTRHWHKWEAARSSGLSRTLPRTRPSAFTWRKMKPRFASMLNSAASREQDHRDRKSDQPEKRRRTVLGGNPESAAALWLLTPQEGSSLCTPKANPGAGHSPSEAHMPRLLPALLLQTTSL